MRHEEIPMWPVAISCMAAAAQPSLLSQRTGLWSYSLIFSKQDHQIAVLERTSSKGLCYVLMVALSFKNVCSYRASSSFDNSVDILTVKEMGSKSQTCQSKFPSRGREKEVSDWDSVFVEPGWRLGKFAKWGALVICRKSMLPSRQLVNTGAVSQHAFSRSLCCGL